MSTHELTEKALDAFWAVIVHEYPEAQTGDLSFERTVKLRLAAEAAIGEWIENNVPDESTRETQSTNEGL